MLDTNLEPAAVVDLDAIKIGRLIKKADPLGALKALWEAGQLLAQKKLSVGHGHWLAWLKTNEQALWFKERTANRFMKFAKTTLATDLTPEQAAVELAKVGGHDPIKHAKNMPKDRGSSCLRLTQSWCGACSSRGT